MVDWLFWHRSCESHLLLRKKEAKKRVSLDVCVFGWKRLLEIRLIAVHVRKKLNPRNPYTHKCAYRGDCVQNYHRTKNKLKAHTFFQKEGERKNFNLVPTTNLKKKKPKWKKAAKLIYHVREMKQVSLNTPHTMWSFFPSSLMNNVPLLLKVRRRKEVRKKKKEKKLF